MNTGTPPPLAAGTNARLGGSLQLSMVEQIFDHAPEIVFFLKDRQGRYAAVNQSLVARCGLKSKKELLGKTVSEIFPRELAEVYWRQDQKVLRTGHPVIDYLEMHWYARRQQGWCLTTKLPIFDQTHAVIGIVGISRDLPAPGWSGSIPPELLKAVQYLETHYTEPLSPSVLARQAGLHPARFARLIKRIYGLAPNQLILQTRLSAAARLLADTKDSVAAVACSCGFYDHSALTRAFRSVTKLSPTKYREVLRHAADSGPGASAGAKGQLPAPKTPTAALPFYSCLNPTELASMPACWFGHFRTR